MASLPRLAILLSTYNGGEFLGEQLDSILNQSVKDIVIVVRDDGSSDETTAVLARYEKNYSEKFCLLPSDDQNLGAKGSFACLMRYVLENKHALGLDRAYMMFADQDDIWIPQKAEYEFQRLLQIERRESSLIPALVHSDLEVIDRHGKCIAESFIAYQGLKIDRGNLVNLALSNLVTGCTAVINEELANKALPIPNDAIMHDWWLAVTAAAFGAREFIDQPLVRYRQHDANAIGAQQFKPAQTVAGGLWAKIKAYEVNPHLSDVAVQARAIRATYGGALSTRQRTGLLLAGFLGLRFGLMQNLLFRLVRSF
jgi:glycosyltransferase involved in cell wall biosynthesis